VSSCIKLGAKKKELVGTMEKEFKCLGKLDMIIINAGANDVSSMRTQTISAVGKMTCFVLGEKKKELVGTMEKDFKCLGKSDMIIINGGANDVSSMRTQTISAVGK
jgi:lysophospholipase L1-like esterase